MGTKMTSAAVISIDEFRTHAAAPSRVAAATTKDKAKRRGEGVFAALRWPRLDGRLDDPKLDATLLSELGAHRPDEG